MSARSRLRSFFEANVGKVVTTHELRDVAGVSEYARRIRELRDEEGMQIRSHIDRHDLKPGEYILESLKKVPAVSRSVPPALRQEILERNGYTCQSCGAGPGDPDPYNPARTVRLHIDHINPATQGGKVEKSNLRVLCSTCNQGRSNIQMPSETAKNLLARIRRNSRAVQGEVYEALKRSFERGVKTPSAEEQE